MSDRNKGLRLARQVVGSLWFWVLAAVLVLGLLAGSPGAWARPDQAPDYQTVPTRTPTPTAPRPNPTATRPSAPPTATPRPPAATNTPVPPPTVTATAGPSPAVTATPTSPGSQAGPTLPAVPPSSGSTNSCWTFPTPGFSLVRLETLAIQADSEEFLVVPGQTIHLRLLVTNQGNATATNLLVCAPLDGALAKAQPSSSQGQVWLEEPGLVAQLGSLPAGNQAELSIELGVPADYPLGGVIEHQAWLFSGSQRASSDLWTWALPPAWLPPTGM